MSFTLAPRLTRLTQEQRVSPILDHLQRSPLLAGGADALRHGQGRQGYLPAGVQDLPQSGGRVQHRQRAPDTGGAVYGSCANAPCGTRSDKSPCPDYHSSVFRVSGMVLVGGCLSEEPQDEAAGERRCGLCYHVCLHPGRAVRLFLTSGVSRPL